MLAAAARVEPFLELLEAERDRAERRLNAIRCAVLLLLAIAALVYAPTLTPALNLANVVVLIPALLWTLVQYVLFYRRPRLPEWLSFANPVADLVAVTAIIAGYGLAQSPVLALKSPIFLAYFAILAARPITSSTRNAAVVAVLAVVLYASLNIFFIASGNVVERLSPVEALSQNTISLLDEGAKLLLLGVAGAIATYATSWHQRMAIGYFRQARDRQMLEARLMQAQLETLKLQLHPHFLFNTLNSIATLITEDPVNAERMLAGLSDLLRLSLRHAGQQEIPLDQELEFLEHYTSIQRIRFADRISISVSADPELGGALVPSFVLQPLVENAIRHGLAPRASGGHVRIAAASHGTRLLLCVEDDGAGPPDTAAEVIEGTGLSNTRARLAYLYGDEHRFTTSGEPGRGFRAEIEIPLHFGA